MAQVFFHCSSTTRVLVDQLGNDIGDLIEAGDVPSFVEIGEAVVAIDYVTRL